MNICGCVGFLLFAFCQGRTRNSSFHCPDTEKGPQIFPAMADKDKEARAARGSDEETSSPPQSEIVQTPCLSNILKAVTGWVAE